MNNNKKQTEKEIQEKIKKVERSSKCFIHKFIFVYFLTFETLSAENSPLTTLEGGCYNTKVGKVKIKH